MSQFKTSFDLRRGVQMSAEFARASSLRDFMRVFGFDKELITLSDTRLTVLTYKNLILIQTCDLW